MRTMKRGFSGRLRRLDWLTNMSSLRTESCGAEARFPETRNSSVAFVLRLESQLPYHEQIGTKRQN